MKAAISCALLFAVAASCGAGTVPGNNVADFYYMETPSQRIKDPGKYFSHEYVQINTRRGFEGSPNRPKFLTGLALSGGGIRSSAFQLGILSGLYRHKDTLSKIDYISSVSGGSWANGAYWAWTLSEDAFFGCLDKAAKFGVVAANCKSAEMLNNEQPFAELPVDDRKLKSRKRQWKEYIESVYLLDCNVNAEEVKLNGVPPECARNYKAKPYIIINASHSVPTLDQGGSEKNMPFQFTLDYIGTISDCFTLTQCQNKGFFVNTLSSNSSWVNKSFFRRDKADNSLSAAMAASSGVASGAMLLSYEYELLTNIRISSMLGNQVGDNIEGIRKDLVLSDGGKSDNLGLLPLIERGTNLIVVSNMGKDKNLTKNPWEDLDLAKKQAKNLLDCDVEIPGNNDDLKMKFIFKTSYVCPKNNIKGTILHIKGAYDNAKIFIKHLEESGYADLAKYLIEKDVDKNSKNLNNKFPQTETMTQYYDEELIRAYYLFGQWIADVALADFITKEHTTLN